MINLRSMPILDMGRVEKLYLPSFSLRRHSREAGIQFLVRAKRQCSMLRIPHGSGFPLRENDAIGGNGHLTNHANCFKNRRSPSKNKRKSPMP